MQAIKEKAQVFLSILLATHDSRTAAVLLEGAVDEFGGKGFANTGLEGQFLPALDFALLNHGKFIYKVNPNEENVCVSDLWWAGRILQEGDTWFRGRGSFWTR